jgi:SAM-dependent methyltransferase
VSMPPDRTPSVAASLTALASDLEAPDLEASDLEPAYLDASPLDATHLEPAYLDAPHPDAPDLEPLGERGRDHRRQDRETLKAYAAGAASYDHRTDRFMVFRKRLVDALNLRRGDIVVDVGCGTGLCLPLLQEKVGTEGEIFAVDESVAMLDIARTRAAQAGWSNVSFLVAPASEVDLPVDADAALFCAVHDILRCPDSVENILAQLRPGAQVASGGGKWAAPWLLLLNTYIRALHRPFVRSFDGFDRPWSVLGAYLQELDVTDLEYGAGYVATGRLPD